MKTLAPIMLVILFIALSWNSYGDEKHHVNRGTSVNVSSQALSIATAQIHPELGTSKLQLGFGIGMHNNDTAIAIGAHKRVNKILIGGILSSGNGQIAVGAGLNIKF